MQSLKAVSVLAALAGGVFLPFGSASAQSSELPEGPGKDFASKNCTGCHGVELVTAQGRSSEEWAEVVSRMISNGDSLTENEYNEVVSYLGTYLGKAPAGGMSPVPSNAPGDKVSVVHPERDGQAKSK